MMTPKDRHGRGMTEEDEEGWMRMSVLRVVLPWGRQQQLSRWLMDAVLAEGEPLTWSGWGCKAERLCNNSNGTWGLGDTIGAATVLTSPRCSQAHTGTAHTDIHANHRNITAQSPHMQKDAKPQDQQSYKQRIHSKTAYSQS